MQINGVLRQQEEEKKVTGVIKINVTLIPVSVTFINNPQMGRWIEGEVSSDNKDFAFKVSRFTILFTMFLNVFLRT